MRDFLPTPYRWEPPPRPFYEIVYNWLKIEISATAEIDMPFLKEICGHRRRDVISYYDATRDRWDRDICMRLYGAA